MKLRYLLFIAFALVVPAQFASATPVDPTVIINKVLGGDAITFTTNSISSPLVITLDSEGLFPTETFEYTGKKQLTLTDFFIAMANPQPFEEFTGQSNVFKAFDIISTVGTPFSDDVELKFFDGKLVLNPGDMITLEVTPTPESGTIVLLLTGGVLLAGLGLGRKW